MIRRGNILVGLVVVMVVAVIGLVVFSFGVRHDKDKVVTLGVNTSCCSNVPTTLTAEWKRYFGGCGEYGGQKTTLTHQGGNLWQGSETIGGITYDVRLICGYLGDSTKWQIKIIGGGSTCGVAVGTPTTDGSPGVNYGCSPMDVKFGPFQIGGGAGGCSCSQTQYDLAIWVYP